MAKSAKTRKKPAASKRERSGEYVGFRSPVELKEKLEAAAASAGRSLSSEAQFRLEQSFRDDTMVEQALSLAFGPRLSPILSIIGRVAGDTGIHAAFAATGSPDDARDWNSNPFAFDQAAKAVMAVFEAFRPEGAIAQPTTSDADAAAKYARLGELIAAGALEAVKNPERGGEIGSWARPIRERLGNMAGKLRVDDSVYVVSVMKPTSNQPAMTATMHKTRDKKGDMP